MNSSGYGLGSSSSSNYGSGSMSGSNSGSRDAVREISSFIEEIERKLAAKARFSSERSTPAIPSQIASPVQSSPCLSPRSLASGLDPFELERKNAELVAEINALKRNTGKLVFAKKTLERDVKALTDVAKSLRNTNMAVASIVSEAERNITPRDEGAILLIAKIKNALFSGSASSAQVLSSASGSASTLVPPPSPSFSSLSMYSAATNDSYAMDYFAKGSAAATPLQTSRKAQELDHENRQLQAELTLFRQEKIALREQIASLKSSLEEERKRNISKMASASSHLTSSASSVGLPSAAAASSNGASSKMRSEMANAHIKRIQEVVISNKGLEKKVASLEEQRTEMEHHIAVLNAEKAAVEEQLELSKSVAKTLTQSYENASKKANEANAEIAKLRDDHAVEIRLLKAQLEDTESAVVAMKTERDALNSQIESLLEQKKHGDEQILKLDSELHTLRDVNGSLSVSLRNAEAQIKKLESEMKELSEQMSLALQTKMEATTLNANLREEVGTLSHRFEMLKEYAESEKNKSRTEIDSLRMELDHVSQDKRKVLQQYAELFTECDQLKLRVGTMQRAIQALEAEKEATENEKSQWLEEYMQAIENLSVEKFDLEQKLSKQEESMRMDPYRRAY